MNKLAMKLSAIALVAGIALLAASLFALHSQSAWTTHDNSAGNNQAAHLVIPAHALPPFDPAATRMVVNDDDGALIVMLSGGGARHALHIVPATKSARHETVHVLHARHGEVMTLQLDRHCDTAPTQDSRARRCSPEAA